MRGSGGGGVRRWTAEPLSEGTGLGGVDDAVGVESESQHAVGMPSRVTVHAPAGPHDLGRLPAFADPYGVLGCWRGPLRFLAVSWCRRPSSRRQRTTVPGEPASPSPPG